MWQDDGSEAQCNCSSLWTECNGNVPHAVEAYQGVRFSVVWYTVATDRKVRQSVSDSLLALSFHIPPGLCGSREGRYGLFYEDQSLAEGSTQAPPAPAASAPTQPALRQARLDEFFRKRAP